MSEANDKQVGGNHYKGTKCPHCDQKMEVWDVAHMLHLDFWQFCLLKYIVRWKLKAGLEDLQKARHYLDKYIEVMCLESGKHPDDE